MPVEDCVQGNEAAARAAYVLSEAAFIYPITPSSPMAELADTLSATGTKNAFGGTTKVYQLQSEGGAVASLHGSLTAGTLTTTFTSSQGLLLMIPTLGSLVGMRLPGVLHVAARGIRGGGYTMYADHGDVMSCRQTGIAMLASHSVQDAHILSIVSHLTAINASTPVMHFFDGFRTSHEVNKVTLLDVNEISALIDRKALSEFRARSMHPARPCVRGTPQGPDIFFQSVESLNAHIDAIPDVVSKAMKDVASVAGVKPIDIFTCSAPEARLAIVVMCSGSDTVHSTLRALNRDKDVAVVRVYLYRPWSKKHFLSALPETVRRVCVLDRSCEHGSPGGPLFGDVCSSLVQSGRNLDVLISGRYGLGMKEFTPAQCVSVLKNLEAEKPMDGFSVGIEDDVTHLSLPVSASTVEGVLPEGTRECVFFGVGGDGTIGANMNAIKLIGNNTPLHVQGFFEFSAHKAGGLTISNLRFGPVPIHAAYLVVYADYLACHHPSYVRKYSSALVRRCAPGGVFVLNTTWASLESIEKHFPAELRRGLAKKDVKLFVIDASSVANEAGLGNRINNVMQTVFFHLSGVMPFEESIKLFKSAIEKMYRKKGQEIVSRNFHAVDLSLDRLINIEYDRDSWLNAVDNTELSSAERIVAESGVDSKDAPPFVSEIMRRVVRLEGDDLPVSALAQFNGPLIPSGSSKYEKRALAERIPIVDMEKCRQCNECTLYCPHAAIRPFLLTDEELSAAPTADDGKVIDARKARGGRNIREFNYRIQVSPLDCTSCGVCVNICPADALSWEKNDDVAVAREGSWWNYCTEKVKVKSDVVDRNTVKGSQFQQPLVEFGGACPGCGEPPYMKLLTQLFGERLMLAVATGCSLIWSAANPVSAYTMNAAGRGPAWSNSLFEDNAEFGYGIAVSNIIRRRLLKEKVEEFLSSSAEDSSVNQELRLLLQEWLEKSQEADRANELAALITAMLEGNTDERLKEIVELKESFEKLSYWIVGGDGWAYDIGFGGLDHVLASGEDLNILVLDNEAYSNTGGQLSKATPIGAVAKFASQGKRRRKKDLGVMAMSYSDVYVASCSLGANPLQTLRAFREADSYSGTSIIMTYVPCIEHQIRGGMSQMVDEQKLAVNSGYWPLYRFSPDLRKKGKNPFSLDSKKVTEDVKKFLERENRFAALQRTAPADMEGLQQDLVQACEERQEKFKSMAEMKL